MEEVVSISEALKSAAGGGRVHATADALYDETKQELAVTLCLSGASGESKDVRTKVSQEEAVDAAKDIFHSWVRGLVRQGRVCIENA